MSAMRFEPFRDPFRETDRLVSMAASGTRAPLGMPMDVYRGSPGPDHPRGRRQPHNLREPCRAGRHTHRQHGRRRRLKVTSATCD